MDAVLMLSLIAVHFSAHQDQGVITFTDGVAIRGVSANGRTPVGFDSVQDQIVHGDWKMPKAGDSLPTATGGTAAWRAIKPGQDGSFAIGGGYFATSFDAPKDQAMILEAAPDTLVYVNGAPRGGDPYGYGYLRVPVWMVRGQNTFLFSAGRGNLKARFVPPRAPIQIETGDLTLPDIIVGGPKNLKAGIVFVNSTPKAQTFRISTKSSAGTLTTCTGTVQPLTFRKLPVDFTAPDGDLGEKQNFDVEVSVDGKSDKATVTLEVKKPTDTHRETFISGIDGSLQYYGVNPSQNPKKSDALVLSLHGAGVEGVGQAAAYGHKDWLTLVAPTNRRPYGFDWEDIGRLDALEVLGIAKKEFPHDPASVHLTGHSMGGHGTWAVGTLYPDTFASIAPSAGWISFWTYAGGYRPRNATPVEETLMQAMSPSDTLARVNNTLEEQVYILHGGADDNVPVDQARQMKKELTDIHANFEYYEEPGAGHWWDTHIPGRGASCVDWPGIFDQIKSSRLTVRDRINFTTPSPAVSSHDEWVNVLEQTRAMVPSVVKIDGSTGTTTNVAALRLDRAFDSLTLDGQSVGHVSKGSTLINSDGHWSLGRLKDGDKSPENSGPFKNVYQNRFQFVIATHGTAEENAWAAEKARYDAETYQYRGNGSVDIVTDSEYRPSDRNVVLYGNADTNSAWKGLLGSCPIQVNRTSITFGTEILTAANMASLFVYPHKSHGRWILVGAITGTGLVGCRTTDRLSIFSSGVAYPDWMILGADSLKTGAKGIRGCGFFDNHWKQDHGQEAWNIRVGGTDTKPIPQTEE